MSGLRFESMADMPPRMRELYARQQIDLSGAAAPAPIHKGSHGKTKYGSRKDTRGELRFDSKKEARRYDELALLLAAEKIRDLKLQPEYTLQEAYTTLEGVRVRAIRYRADFSYERATEPDCCGEVHWLRVVEDVKSEATKTRGYAIKRKLMRERLGIDVREV